MASRPSAGLRAVIRDRVSPLDRAIAHLTYVRADLIRIGIVSAILLVVLIVLTFILR